MGAWIKRAWLGMGLAPLLALPLAGPLAAAPPRAPVIDVWYGDTQSFGARGVPQRFANVLGTVSDPDGVTSLTYSLNGGPERPLLLGPDLRRLARPGDFNADIPLADLTAGSNQLVLRATDALGARATATVAMSHTTGRVWPLPYTIDWSSVRAIQDVAQVVDGLWTLGPDGVRPRRPTTTGCSTSAR